MELSKVTLEIFSKLEHKWLYHIESKKTRVLSIDGGGTTGIVAGTALIHLEEQIRSKTGNSNASIIDFFDIIAGTGIGAVLASMLVADDGNGRPLYSAKEAVDFLSRNQEEMFKVKSRNVDLFRSKRRFSGKCIENVLKAALTRDNGKELTLKDTCKPLLIPCFDLNSAAPFVFSRADASESSSFDFELWKVCRATSSNPSTFKPFKFNSINGKTSCVGIDGGLVMNNPTSAAITHVLHNKREFGNVNSVEDLLVLSIGSGTLCSKESLKLRRNGGCAASAIVGVVLDGVSETVDQLLGNAFCFNHNDYVRIQANGLSSGGEGGGVLEERGVETMPFGGKRLLTETNGERIGGFVQRLVASGRSSLPPSPCKDITVSPLANGR
ncbi:hypothetical protein Leryth_009050 [Lithospermum erythrorhizon]|nr:hypothetical protein Leryth_009050 [Lithospermum erythrorhizon]